MIRKIAATAALAVSVLVGFEGAAYAVAAPKYNPPTEEAAERYVAALEKIHPGFEVTIDRRLERDADLICGRILAGKITTGYVIKVTRSKYVKLTKSQAKKVIKAVRVWCK